VLMSVAEAAHIASIRPRQLNAAEGLSIGAQN
jgi:hypothetical protein